MAKKQMSDADRKIAKAMKAGGVLTPGGTKYDSPKEDRGETRPAITEKTPEFGVSGTGVHGRKGAGITGTDLAPSKRAERPAPSTGVSGHDVLGIKPTGRKYKE